MGLAGMFAAVLVALVVAGFMVYGLFLGMSAMIRIVVSTYRLIAAK